MIRDIRTREELERVVQRGQGYLFNAFDRANQKNNPIHAVLCSQVPRMLQVRAGTLSVKKVWSDSLVELIAHVRSGGRVFSFCGMEPELDAMRISHRAPVSSSSGPHASSRSDRPVGMDGRGRQFHVRGDGSSVVEAWSGYRLRFDSKPETLALRDALRAAIRQLSSPREQILHATYTTECQDQVDAENVLFYNVGVGNFASAASHGICFERRSCAPPLCPQSDFEPAHHHAYGFVPLGSPFECRLERKEVASWSGVNIPRIDEISKPDTVWHSLRLSKSLIRVTSHRGPYALRLEIAADRARSADALKAVIDGFVSALHAHDGRDSEIVVPRLASRLGVPDGDVRDLLMDVSAAVLGVRRLIWPRATGYQWNPNDADCVACELVTRPAISSGWMLSGSLWSVDPRSE